MVAFSVGDGETSAWSVNSWLQSERQSRLQPPIYLSIHLSIHLCLPIDLPGIYLSIHPTIYLSICLSIYLTPSARLSSQIWMLKSWSLAFSARRPSILQARSLKKKVENILREFLQIVEVWISHRAIFCETSFKCALSVIWTSSSYAMSSFLLACVQNIAPATKKRSRGTRNATLATKKCCPQEMISTRNNHISSTKLTPRTSNISIQDAKMLCLPRRQSHFQPSSNLSPLSMFVHFAQTHTFSSLLARCRILREPRKATLERPKVVREWGLLRFWFPNRENTRRFHMLFGRFSFHMCSWHVSFKHFRGVLTLFRSSTAKSAPRQSLLDS